MSDERAVRAALWASIPLNTVGAIVLGYPSSALGGALGLPGDVPALYSTLCAVFVAAFAAAYLWLVLQTRLDRPLIGLAALVKTSVFGVFLLFWLAGSVTDRGLWMVVPHAAVAAVFFAWLSRNGREA